MSKGRGEEREPAYEESEIWGAGSVTGAAACKISTGILPKQQAHSGQAAVQSSGRVDSVSSQQASTGGTVSAVCCPTRRSINNAKLRFRISCRGIDSLRRSCSCFPARWNPRHRNRVTPGCQMRRGIAARSYLAAQPPSFRRICPVRTVRRTARSSFGSDYQDAHRQLDEQRAAVPPKNSVGLAPVAVTECRA